ncbi:MAG: molybdopterin-dependent oxidoreductase [Thermoplasmata archaeon]
MKYYSACPRDCYDACSIITEINDGKISIYGNRIHPYTDGFLCLKSKWYVKASHGDARLTEPMIKKNDKFEKISWNDAFKIISERIKDPERFLPYDYAGNRALISYNFPQRMFNYFGTLKLNHSLCDEAGNISLINLLGSSTGYNPDDINKSDLFVYWGMNPVWTNIHGWAKVKKNVEKIVVIDPEITETAKSSFMHIRIFPGKDFKFAMFVAKMLNVKMKKYPDFIMDFDELDENDKKNAEKFSEMLMKAKNPVIHIGYGFQKQINGGITVMAIAFILSILDKDYNFIYDRRHRIDYDYLRGKNENRKEINQYTIADQMDKFDTLFIYGSNPFNSLPNQKKFRERIIEKDIFVITHDLYLNDTVMNSNLILPAAHFFEFNDLVDSYYHDYISLNQKIADPLGLSLSNHDLFVNLAKFMELNDPFLIEDEMNIIDNIIKRSNIDRISLFEKGYAWIEPEIIRKKFDFNYFMENIDKYRKENSSDFRLISSTNVMSIGSLHNNLYDFDTYAYINDEDAEQMNIKDNDTVKIFNEKYSIITRIKVSGRIMKKTVVIYRGSWVKNYGWNVNFLTDDKSQLYNGPSFQSTFVKIEKL